MGANFSRIKTWVATEDLEFDDLNAEFDNILNNLTAANVDDFSATVLQMQSTADPGEVGSESKATSVAGEIQRLRFLIQEITGEDQWYESPVSSLLGLANAVGTGITDNRIVSGKVRTTSSQPIFLNANGAAKTVTVKGAVTNFIYDVDGVEYTISTDVSLTGLTAAPSSNNTTLVNDAIAGSSDSSKYYGENGGEIIIDTVGSEITALIGKVAGFKVVHSGVTEYFIAQVETNRLIKAERGYFFDSSDAPVPRVVLVDNDVITLMKLTWVFAKTNGTLTATYNPPVWSKDEPTSPSVGDYWFDLANNTWMIYGVGSFTAANATLIGACIQDATNTVAARSFEFFKNYSDLNTVELILESNTQVRSRFRGSLIGAWGETIKNDHNLFVWDMTLDLDSGVSENASTYYYFYITQAGDKIISDIRPFNRQEDLRGYYHPHQSWRCVGYAFNNGSSNLSSVVSFYSGIAKQRILNSQTTASRIEVIDRFCPVDTSGGAVTKTIPPAAYWKGQVMTFLKTTSDFTAVTLATTNSENIIEGTGSTTSITLNTQGESADLFSDGTQVFVMKRSIPVNLPAYAPTVSGFGTIATTGYVSWRLGRFFEAQLYWTNGTVAGTTATVTLPTNVAVDTTANTGLTRGNTSGNPGEVVGEYGSNVANLNGPIVTATGTSTVLLYFGSAHTSSNYLTPTVGSTVSNTSAIMSAKFKIPVSGWGG